MDLPRLSDEPHCSHNVSVSIASFFVNFLHFHYDMTGIRILKIFLKIYNKILDRGFSYIMFYIMHACLVHFIKYSSDIFKSINVS